LSLNTRHIYKTYSGYVLSQFRRMANAFAKTGSYKAKHAMHLVRLLYSGIEALTSGEIRIDVAEHREELLAIRSGASSFEQAKSRALDLDREFQEASRRTSLPEQPDYRQANEFLIWARSMLDVEGLQGLVEGQDYAPLFVTVSGAHLYGFPSPDSDVDLRGCHMLPLRVIVSLDQVGETIERKCDLAGTEVELVSHDLGKYLRLLVKNNGYVLEQIFSPIVVLGQQFLEELRPLAKRCITRHHYHHYRGFLATQRKLLLKQEPKSVKTLLYAYRVVLSGIHLLKTGEVEAFLPRLAEEYQQTFADELIAQKRQEKAVSEGLDWAFHDGRLTELEAMLDQSYEQSPLPVERDRDAVNRFLVEWRLQAAGVAPGEARL
jgi:predicted nucleotidyltransferase